VLVVAPEDTVSSSKRLGMAMIDVALKKQPQVAIMIYNHEGNDVEKDYKDAAVILVLSECRSIYLDGAPNFRASPHQMSRMPRAWQRQLQ
jgi:hypothetical protein